MCCCAGVVLVRQMPDVEAEVLLLLGLVLELFDRYCVADIQYVYWQAAAGQQTQRLLYLAGHCPYSLSHQHGITLILKARSRDLLMQRSCSTGWIWDTLANQTCRYVQRSKVWLMYVQ